MKTVFTLAALVLSLTPAFAFAKSSDNLEGTQITCKGGFHDLTLTIGEKLAKQNVWETHYAAMLTGPRLYQPSQVIAQSVSTRVYGGLELTASYNGNTLKVMHVLYSSNQNWAPLGLSGSLVNPEGKLLLNLSCQYL